jgi:hypothetical protein
MAALDRTKEELAYLKFWQGIVVVTDISVGGWLISGATGAALLAVAFVLGLLGLISLSIIAMVLHRQIRQRIKQIGEL